MLLDTERDLCLRPMKYPQFFEMYKNAIANTWTTDEIDFSVDVEHLRDRITPQEAHLIKRLVAFFASADSLVADNLVLNLYKSIQSPEYRMFLSRQLFEEALHIEAYLLLVDTYIKDDLGRKEAFDAYKTVPSIAKKADFLLSHMQIVDGVVLDSDEKRKQFLLNLICFACCIEGLFFFGSFAYVYFLRSKGLLPGLATATDWVFRDETAHIEAAMCVIDTIKIEYPQLFDKDLENKVKVMMQEALEAEEEFCNDALSAGITGITSANMRQYLQYVIDGRLVRLGYRKLYSVTNPFPFMVLQDLQPLTNFFDKKVTQYTIGITGEVTFDESF